MTQQRPENEMLLGYAERLGQETPVSKKAEEYLRVLQNKAPVKSANDAAKTVICLNLAALLLDSPFDKATAVKLSGLRKSNYQASLNTIEKLLNLDRRSSVRDLCVQFKCTEVRTAAEQILSRYKAKVAGAELSHPQYVAAAVFCACKAFKIKTSRQKFITVSHLKPSQWKELEVEFSKLAEHAGVDKRCKMGNRDAVVIIEQLAVDKENCAGKPVPKNRRPKEAGDEEEYEAWKKRILDEATAALGVDSGAFVKKSHRI